MSHSDPKISTDIKPNFRKNFTFQNVLVLSLLLLAYWVSNYFNLEETLGISKLLLITAMAFPGLCICTTAI